MTARSFVCAYRITRMAQWIACVACLVALPTLAAAQALEPGRTWTSLHGSTLIIQSVSQDGSFTGTFTNRRKGFSCSGVPYAVTGWQDGIIVAFSVRFDGGTPKGNCQAVASWVGYLVNNLEAYWDMIYLKSASPKRLHGHDTFR